ncbi:MAG TPA: sodium/proline symporter [Thermoanaerobaculia bacterium]|nr:sodium/proline symporter [Thermoanaerobaculia bacterium]
MEGTAVSGGGTEAAIAFVAYLALVVGLGVASARFSSAGLAEFFVGGRRMHRFVVALSAVVSGRSAWLLLGVTGLAYARGASAVWAVVGYIVVEAALFLGYAPRLRRFAGAYDCVTVPDFFAVRFGEASGGRSRGDGLLRGVLVTIVLVFMVGYVAAQFVAGGKAFAASFGWSETAGVVATAAIVLAYTVLGGFLAVSLTDVVQACFMIVALVVVPLVAITDRGGLGAVLAELTALDPSLVDPAAIGVGAALGFLGIGLGSPGNPHILARYLSIGDAEQLRWVAVVGTVWNVVMAWGALFIGLAGRAWFPAVGALPGADPENLYLTLAGQLLPPLLFGAVLASVFAAIMSTADSQLLVAASSLVRDLYDKVWRAGEEISPRRLVALSRATVAVLVVAALALALGVEELVFWLVLFAWAGLGAALGPTSILALTWRGTTRGGVIAGALAGATVTIAWKLTPALADLLYELLPGFAAGLAVTWLVSRAGRRPADVETMFAAMAGPPVDGMAPHRDEEPRR